MPTEIYPFVFTLVRAGLYIVVGWFVKAGFIDAGQSGAVTDALAHIGIALAIGAGTLAWNLWVRRRTELIRAVANMRGVSTVHASPELAARVNDPSVVPTPPASP